MAEVKPKLIIISYMEGAGQFSDLKYKHNQFKPYSLKEVKDIVGYFTKQKINVMTHNNDINLVITVTDKSIFKDL